MQLTTLFAVATAITATSAHPSVMPNHRHARRNHGEFYMAVRPDTSSEAAPAPTTTSATAEYKVAEVVETTSTSSAVPTTLTTTTAAAASTTTSTAAASTSASSGSGSSSGKKAFCASSGNQKRTTLEDIAAVGNTGNANTPNGVTGAWGCNIMQVDCGSLSLYDYGVQLSSTGSKYTCSAYNKIGPKGLIDGFWFSALDFTVSGGANTCIAIDADSQGGFACSEGDSVTRTSAGQLGGTWAEWDMGSKRNAGNSGADVSSLVAGDTSTPWIPMFMQDPNGKVCSQLKSDGTNKDAYVGQMHDLSGVGCKGYKKGILKVALGDRTMDTPW